MNRFFNATKWFTPWFWRYVFEGNYGWRNIWCRLRNHPNGTIYYNIGGEEPDDRCKDCGEDLG